MGINAGLRTRWFGGVASHCAAGSTTGFGLRIASASAFPGSTLGLRAAASNFSNGVSRDDLNAGDAADARAIALPKSAATDASKTAHFRR